MGPPRLIALISSVASPDMIDGEVGGNALADAPALDLRAESKDLACHVRHGMRFSFCSLGYLPQRSRYWSDTACTFTRTSFAFNCDITNASVRVRHWKPLAWSFGAMSAPIPVNSGDSPWAYNIHAFSEGSRSCCDSHAECRLDDIG